MKSYTPLLKLGHTHFRKKHILNVRRLNRTNEKAPSHLNNLKKLIPVINLMNN